MLIGKVSFAVDVVEGSDVPPDASVQLAMREKRAVAITGSGYAAGSPQGMVLEFSASQHVTVSRCLVTTNLQFQ